MTQGITGRVSVGSASAVGTAAGACASAWPSTGAASRNRAVGCDVGFVPGEGGVKVWWVPAAVEEGAGLGRGAFAEGNKKRLDAAGAAGKSACDASVEQGWSVCSGLVE